MSPACADPGAVGTHAFARARSPRTTCQERSPWSGTAAQAAAAGRSRPQLRRRRSARRLRPEHPHPGRQITKMLVASVVLQLAAKDKVNLDAPIERYLPGRIRGEGIDATAITVRQLLRHQSGLPGVLRRHDEVPAEPVTARPACSRWRLTTQRQFAPGASIEVRQHQLRRRRATDRATDRQGLPARRSPAASSRRWASSTPISPPPGENGLRAPFAHGYELVDGRLQGRHRSSTPSATGMSGIVGVDQRGHTRRSSPRCSTGGSYPGRNWNR